MKIDACIITKNEIYFIEKLIKNLSKFCDNIYITDTGSTDRTWDKLQDLTKEYSNLFIDQYEWNDNFGEARNHVWQKSQFSDYRFFCDASDDFTPELIDALIEFKKKPISDDLPYFIYIDRLYGGVYAPLVALSRNLPFIVWKDPIHEYINQENHFATHYFDNTKCYLIHDNIRFRPKEYSSRNIKIFHNMDENGYKFSARNLYYYANENFWHHNYIVAYKLYEEALKNHDGTLYPISIMEIFIFLSCCVDVINPETHIADSAIIYGEEIYNKNCKCKKFLEVLGYTYFKFREYKKTIKILEECLSFDESVNPENRLHMFPNDVSLESIYNIIMLSYTELQDFKNANKYNEMLLEMFPNDEGLINNKKILAEKMNEKSNGKKRNKKNSV